MAYSLQDKGEVYAALETAVGVPLASALAATNVQNLRSFKTRIVPIKVPVEDEGGGVIAGTMGQEMLKVSEHVEYSATMLMREFTVPAIADTTRPNYDIWLRSGGFLPAVYNVGNRTLTYNMALANNGEQLAYQYREWASDTSRKLHLVNGGRHSTKFKFVAGAACELEFATGFAPTYTQGTAAASANPPSLTYNAGPSAIPFKCTTATLTQVGGGTYTGKVREFNFDLPQRTEVLPSADSCTGFSEAFSSVMAPTMDLLLYERNDGLQIRDAANVAGAHFRLVLSIANPGSANNTLEFDLYFDIIDVTEEAGPVGTKAVRVNCKPLFANTPIPGVDPSELPFKLTLKTV